MAIRPLDLPSAAGVDYGGADVRHFSPGDAVDVPGIQNPTRHLAERDNLLAEKVNEIVGVVNNREQFVPLPIVRTVLSPSESMVVTNYRIPVGFESRILNASVSATPALTDIELDVFYSAGTFGSTTGQSIVTTANEFTGGVSFYQTGEFIVTLKNKSAVVLELSASVLLTLRPVGAEGSLLAASVIQGPNGVPGPTGPPGPPGTPGSGGAGTPGMIWTGTFQFGRTYRDKEVASINLYGTVLSSFIARTTTTEDPQTSFFANDGVWNPVAIGSAGPAGAAGPTGAAGTNAPAYKTSTTSGTLYFGADYQTGTPNGDYSGSGSADGGSASSIRVVSMTEASIVSAGASPKGMAFLSYQRQCVFSGTEVIGLPTVTDGGSITWDATNVRCSVLVDGVGVTPSLPYELATTTVVGFGSIAVAIKGGVPVKTTINLIGIQSIP